ncbi:hypothetical protein [Clostridium sp. BJN0013]|uniref:hypothetical protein n=1 Tax=Clostridium sp. BJN0013 TaxID=3236840 RepID=UPI0034C6534C
MTSTCSLENHLAKFIGKTITICTTGGGKYGSFTGILLYSNNGYIRLITRAGAAPDCLPGNNCMPPFTSRDSYSNMTENFDKNNINNSGCIIDIPICAITSFIHNSI